MPTTVKKPRFVICASGEGTNFEAIVQATRQERLQAEVVGLLANRGKIGAIGRASLLKIPHRLLAPKAFDSQRKWDSAVLAQLKEWKADWVILAGFLARIGPQVLQAFPQRIVNSHPALLPRHGGAGMYGINVHRAVLAAGETETGVTVHLIDEEFDKGVIVAQEKIAVRAGDTAESLEDRVKAAESAFYPRVLNDLVTGRITIG